MFILIAKFNDYDYHETKYVICSSDKETLEQYKAKLEKQRDETCAIEAFYYEEEERLRSEFPFSELSPPRELPKLEKPLTKEENKIRSQEGMKLRIKWGKWHEKYLIYNGMLGERAKKNTLKKFGVADWKPHLEYNEVNDHAHIIPDFEIVEVKEV
jgi:hypothetical protein